VQRWQPFVRPSDVMTAATPCRPSFEQVYEEQRHQLLRLAVLLTGSLEQAEDVVQGAFASAYPRWDAIRQPSAYLKKAVVNGSADRHRRRRRDRALAAEREPVTGMPEVDETWASLRSLPARQRAVLVLHFYEDLPLVDVADVLDRPAATIRSDLRRALQTLRKDLS
jgi:RNA polymerase sigma-70 factor (sigma-E family)